MKKSSKRLIISTEALNSFGFRIITAGIDLSDYLKNPILLYSHALPQGNSKDQILPLGFMSDLQVSNNQLSGIPNFDDTDTFAISIYNKVENGTLKMCSAGLVPLEKSSNPAVMLPEQTEPTVTKSKLIEVSICMIGANPDAYAVALYNKTGVSIKLSSTNTKAIFSDVRDADLNASLHHTPKTLAIVNNAVAAGKLNLEDAKTLLNQGNDDKSVATILKTIRTLAIDPKKWEGRVQDGLLPMLSQSWYDLKMKVPGDGTKTLKLVAPDAYKAKFFEEHGRLPAEFEGKLA